MVIDAAIGQNRAPGLLAVCIADMGAALADGELLLAVAFAVTGALFVGAFGVAGGAAFAFAIERRSLIGDGYRAAARMA